MGLIKGEKTLQKAVIEKEPKRISNTNTTRQWCILLR